MRVSRVESGLEVRFSLENAPCMSSGHPPIVSEPLIMGSEAKWEATRWECAYCGSMSSGTIPPDNCKGCGGGVFFPGLTI